MQEIREVHNQFAGYELKEEIKNLRKKGLKKFNSLKIEKLFYFISEENIDFSELYDYYLHNSNPIKRKEHESKEEFINRTRLQKVLGKAKPYFYNYERYNN